MKAPITMKQWELLSAYLDGKLSEKDKKSVEIEIASNPELKKALTEITNLKGILRSVPLKRVRRNFTITAAQAKPARRSFIVPVFRFASLASAVALVALLVVQFAPGLFSLPGASKAAESAPMAMAVAPASESPTALPPIILWNGYYPSATGGAEGKGGGGGGGYGGGPAVGGGSGQITPTPVNPPTLLGGQPPLTPTPVPTATPTQTPVVSTDQQRSLSDGPFLGIQPTEVQGQIIAEAPLENTTPLRQPTVFHITLINYFEAGLALLAVGFLVTALLLRRRS